MGGRGNAGTRSTGASTETVSISQKVDSFISELENRQYGSSKKLVPTAQEREFDRARAEIINYLKNDNFDTIIPASGFRGFSRKPEEYIHTAAKLNAYQRLLRSEARNLKQDIEFGIVNEERASLELRALRSIDKMIQERRKDL